MCVCVLAVTVSECDAMRSAYHDRVKVLNPIIRWLAGQDGRNRTREKTMRASTHGTKKILYLLHMTQQAYRIIYVLINLQSILIILVLFPFVDAHAPSGIETEREL